VLVIPKYDKGFIVFFFCFKIYNRCCVVTKNEENQEQPIAFFTRALRDAELRYNNMEKQEYALVKASKSFRHYILHSKLLSYVPTSTIKDILTQPNNDGIRGKWISKLQEYDLEIKPTKMIKGQGLAKLIAKSNYMAQDINSLSIDIIEAKPEEDETQEQT